MILYIYNTFHCILNKEILHELLILIQLNHCVCYFFFYRSKGSFEE